MNIFQVVNNSDNSAKIRIDGYIGGWEADPIIVRDQLDRLGDVQDIYVELSSGGGSAFHGMAIYQAFKNHPANIHIQMGAVVASAATTIAMSASPGMLSMYDTSIAMIHEASMDSYGTADELETRAKLLRKVNQTVRKAIVSRDGLKLSDEQVAQAMSETTWYTADEAKEVGLIDNINEATEEVTNCVEVKNFDFSVYKNVPERILNLSKKEADSGETNDGQAVPILENAMKKYDQTELDAAVNKAVDKLMDRVKQIFGHEKAPSNFEFALHQVTSSSTTEEAIKNLGFLPDNKAPVKTGDEKEGDEPENSGLPAEGDDVGIATFVENLAAQVLNKVSQDSNIDIPGLSNDGNSDDGEGPEMTDEQRGEAAAKRLENGDLH